MYDSFLQWLVPAGDWGSSHLLADCECHSLPVQSRISVIIVLSLSFRLIILRPSYLQFLFWNFLRFTLFSSICLCTHTDMSVLTLILSSPCYYSRSVFFIVLCMANLTLFWYTLLCPWSFANVFVGFLSICSPNKFGTV